MKIKYLAFAALAAIGASCSNDEGFDNLKDTPITVTAGVAELTTRAGHDADHLPGKFYLTVTQDATDAASKYNYTNVDMTKGSGNNYTTSTNLLWKDGTRSPFVSAYTTADATFTVQTDQSAAESVIASDLLGAVSTTEGDVTIDGDNISVRFRHLLCKLDVIYSWGTEFDNATKSIKNVVYNGFGTDVTLDRATATITSGSSTDIITTFVGKTTVGEEEKDMSEAIFAPQTGNPKIVITAQIDGVERTFSLNVTPPTDGFVSGKRYTMAVKIGGTGAEISLVSVNDWTEKPVTGVETEQEAFVYNPATNSYEVHLSRGMQAAIDAAELTGTAENPAKVTLLADMEVAGTPNEYGNIEYAVLIESGNIVIDLNGCQLSATNDPKCTIQIGAEWGETSDAVVTIDDSSADKSGKIIGSLSGINNNGGTLIFNNGTIAINNTDGAGASAGISSCMGTITVNGGTINVTGVAEYSVTSGIYEESSSAGTVTINGGSINVNAPSSYALYARSTWYVNGGTITSNGYHVDGTVSLQTNDEGIGATFVDGIKSWNTLNSLLSEGVGYYDADGNLVEVANDVKEITDKGDITVKKNN